MPMPPRKLSTSGSRRARKLQLSPTRISTFLTCRTMYKYDYVERIGRYYHRARAANSFGASVHQALQEFHQAGGASAITAEQLVERTEAVWRPAGFADACDEEEHKALAAMLMQRYWAQDAAKSTETEVFLCEKLLTWDMGLFVLAGRVDRIDEHISDGTLEIVDYKTGRSSITEDEVRSAIAMCIYQVLVKKIWPGRRVLATIHAVRATSSASIELSDDELAQWEDKIRDIGRQIVETDYELLNPVFLPEVCPDCDFLRLCAQFWRSQDTTVPHHIELN